MPRLERFQVLMAANIKITFLWNVALCSLVEIDRRFRGACCPHHQGHVPVLLTWWRNCNHLPKRNFMTFRRGTKSRRTVEHNVTHHCQKPSNFDSEKCALRTQPRAGPHLVQVLTCFFFKYNLEDSRRESSCSGSTVDLFCGYPWFESRPN
jgi:hypothetical protein